MTARWFSHPVCGTAKIIFALPTAITAALLLTAAQPAAAQPGWVLSHQKISDTEGGFTGTLDNQDHLGRSVALLGDLDGDGIGDVAVGAPGDDDGGTRRGAVWVLFLNADGTVKLHQKISDTEGDFTGILDNNDLFGTSVSSLGDMDGDGVTDLAVGAMTDTDGGFERGAVWVLFLNADGKVKTHQKISDTQGGFEGELDDRDLFGVSVAFLGDLDGDGVGDLAVGARNDDDGGAERGAVWILFLNSDGTVKSHQKISDTEGGFRGALDDGEWFGSSVASLGDLDGDGVDDLAVGAMFDNDGGQWRGAVWMLFLNTDGTVKSHQKISDTEGGFTGTLDDFDWFGTSVASLGDLDGDGVGDLAVGAPYGRSPGAAWVLFLNTNGTVKSHQKIGVNEGGFKGRLEGVVYFGYSLAALGDLDGDGIGDLAVGAMLDDDGGFDRGAVWVLFLDDGALPRPPAWVLSHQKVSDTEGDFSGTLDDNDFFGWSTASLGDLDGDGVSDLAVGAHGDGDGGGGRGALWILFLNGDGTVKSHQKISDTEGGFTGILDNGDAFGASVVMLGDLDGDGVGDLAVGARRDDDGGNDRGAIWVLFLNADSTVKSHQKISDTEGGFTGILDDRDWFGISVASLGDLDGDGVGDLAVGAYADDDGGSSRGAVWILFLNADGTVKSHQKISDTEGGFTGLLDDGDHFGWSAASLGDLNGDGVGDLVVGAPNDGDFRGAVWVLFLQPDGTVRAHQKINEFEGGFTGKLERDDQFGWSVAALDDLNGDGVTDLAVGAWWDGNRDRGAVWVLFLNTDGTVKAHHKINDKQGGFIGPLHDWDGFGSSVAFLGTHDNGSTGTLAVGAQWDDDGGDDSQANRGAVWMLSLNIVSCDPCDANCDGSVDLTDVEPFIDLIIGRTEPCSACAGDANNDGSIDLTDVEGFIACLLG